MVSRTLVIVGIILWGWCCSFAADPGIVTRFHFIISHNPPELICHHQNSGHCHDHSRQEESAFSFRNTNELVTLGTGLIRLYQFLISSQDDPTCNFTPSCSRFSVLAIRQHGFFSGWLMTSDRLQRCNGMSRMFYPKDRATGRCYDPVSINYLWR